MPGHSRYWEDVREGDEIPPAARRLSRVDIIAMAFAARDFLPPVHVDPDAARAAGLRDVNLNIIATGGLIGKYLTDWSGPEGVLRRMEYRLATPVYPDDTLAETGKVVKKYTSGGERLVDVEYAFSVPEGPHAWGTATLALPASREVSG